MRIKGFIETSLIDWDGKVVSTLFVPGCNFRCPFCHNFGLIEDPEHYETIPIERIEKYLQEHKDFIDGICLTGGEPCIYAKDGLFEFLQWVKQQGFLVKLDTNGEFPDVLKKLIDEGLVDYIAMDIKGPVEEKYHKMAGVEVDLEKVRQSIRLLMGNKVNYEFRTTVVPEWLDEKDIETIAREIKGAKKFVLQQFDPKNCWDELLRSAKPYDKMVMEKLVEKARFFVPNTVLRGI